MMVFFVRARLKKGTGCFLSFGGSWGLFGFPEKMASNPLNNLSTL